MGSFGDVNPFIGLGLALRARGHEVIVIANAYFERAVEQAGLRFAASTPVESYLEMLNNPDTWHPEKGPALLPGRILAAIPRGYERLRQLNIPGNTVMAATPLAFAATIASESLGIPLTTLLLNPMLLCSAYDCEDRGLGPFGSLVRRWKRRIRFRLNELLCDRLLCPEVNAIRAGLGLRPLRRVWNLWQRRSRSVIGLWPEWLYAPQLDWPRQVVLAGFVEYDAGPGVAGPDGPARLEDGTIAGPPPIVFTAGTARLDAPDFFKAACAACEILGRPGVLLTQNEQPTGRPLPRAVRHIRYAPLGKLLQRAAAIVHCGGIGTAARALRAGIPQLIMPIAYDQHDNAARLARLGVAASIDGAALGPANVAARLSELLESPTVLERCRHFAAKFEGSRAVDEACDHIEFSARAPEETHAA
jgi:rhamnosyltransferase subunit B